MSVVRVTILDRRMRDLVLPSAHLDLLHSGSLWSEGPVYFPNGDYLLWSDIPNNRLMQWLPELGVRIYSHNSNYSNGNTRDAAGRLVTCEHLTRSVVRTEHDGSRTILAARHQGKALNSPNDVVVASDGAVWFTDPVYGILTDFEGQRSTPEQEGCYVYRVDPKTSMVEAKIVSMSRPNGLAFSKDEQTLYVADSSRSHDDAGHHHVMAFEIGANAKVGTGLPLIAIEDGVPDGLRLDEFGNLWVSSARGVEVFAPDGTALGILHVPETVANLTFGGPKNNRLFITATTSLYSVFTAVRGAERPKGN